MANPKIFSPRRRISLSPRLLLLFIVAIVLLYGVIYPNLHVVLLSFQRDGTWSLQNYREVLAQRIVLRAIFSSVAISILTVVFCAAIGIPLAFLFERFTFPARRLFATLAALPLVLPPFLCLDGSGTWPHRCGACRSGKKFGRTASARANANCVAATNALAGSGSAAHLHDFNGFV